MKYVIAILFCVIGFSSFAQDLKKYKIQSVDSTYLEKYFIIVVSESNGVNRKIFSEKKGNETGKMVKVGKRYCLKLTPLNLDISKNDTIKTRGEYSIFVDSNKILEAGEQSYRTDNLKGLIYIRDGK